MCEYIVVFETPRKQHINDGKRQSVLQKKAQGCKTTERSYSINYAQSQCYNSMTDKSISLSPLHVFILLLHLTGIYCVEVLTVFTLCS